MVPLRLVIWIFPLNFVSEGSPFIDCSFELTSCSRQACGEGPFQGSSSLWIFCRVHSDLPEMLTHSSKLGRQAAPSCPLSSFALQRGSLWSDSHFQNAMDKGQTPVSMWVLQTRGSHQILQRILFEVPSSGFRKGERTSLPFLLRGREPRAPQTTRSLPLHSFFSSVLLHLHIFQVIIGFRPQTWVRARLRESHIGGATPFVELGCTGQCVSPTLGSSAEDSLILSLACSCFFSLFPTVFLGLFYSLF